MIKLTLYTIIDTDNLNNFAENLSLVGGLLVDKIAVLIPCYNEEKTIEYVITDFKKYLPAATIYVYDNNSTDKTIEIARRAGAIVRHEYQQGKGNVIRRMFREIDAQCYILVDGDNTYPAMHAPDMADLILYKNVDMVIGDRLSSTYFEENTRRFHGMGNNLVRNLINFFFKSNIKDIMTGYRAFNYQFVKSFPVVSKGFEIETEMSIHAIDKNMHMETVRVEYKDRPSGSESKLNTFSDGFKVLKMILTLYRNYKPFNFFGIIGILLFIPSLLFLIPVINHFINYGNVPQFPTLIVCCFIFLTSIISMTIGIVLQTLLYKEKQDFERHLHIINYFYNELKKENN